ncbi:MAG: SPOR domain-containing protein [Gammaproteobacteria bacterium]|nr:SPOR domain-containing protein [Gammaproteobacteria bacterium]
MDQQLKQRLTGAVVIVSLAVIFIPVILEGPRDEWTPRDHTIPAPPGLDYRAPGELPIPAPATPARTEQPDDGMTADSGPAPQPVTSPAPEPVVVAQAPPPVAKRVQTLANGWYVQVGSFSKSDNAGRLRERLGDAGMDAHVHAVKTGQGTGYRVLVGPSHTRPEAEKLQQKLADSQTLEGIVIEIGGAGDG